MPACQLIQSSRTEPTLERGHSLIQIHPETRVECITNCITHRTRQESIEVEQGGRRGFFLYINLLRSRQLCVTALWVEESRLVDSCENYRVFGVTVAYVWLIPRETLYENWSCNTRWQTQNKIDRNQAKYGNDRVSVGAKSDLSLTLSLFLSRENFVKLPNVKIKWG